MQEINIDLLESFSKTLIKMGFGDGIDEKARLSERLYFVIVGEDIILDHTAFIFIEFEQFFRIIGHL